RARHSTLSYPSIPRMIIIVGARSGLHLAEQEIDMICSVYRQRFHQNVSVCKGEDVTSESVRAILSGLMFGDMDIVHFIGHGDAQADKVWLELSSSPFLDNDVPMKLGGNPLIFWNACHSASSTAGRYRYQADVIDAFGSRLLSAGASHFVG